MAAVSFRSTTLAMLALATAACGDAEEVPAGPPSAGAVVPVRSSSGTVEQKLPPARPAEPADCKAGQIERFIGQEADAETMGEVLEAVAPQSNVRWVGPDDATTDDFDPQRLNVALDAADVIRSARCG